MLPVRCLVAALIRGKIFFDPQNLLTMCTAHAEQAATKCVEWALDTFNQKGECLHGLKRRQPVIPLMAVRCSAC